jgi:hypothetical protein
MSGLERRPDADLAWIGKSETNEGSLTALLSAVIVAMRGDEPMLLTIAGEHGLELPSGPYSPAEHGSLDAGLRAWAHRLTGLEIGHADQLGTVAEQAGRLSVGYLALTQGSDQRLPDGCEWHSWYRFFPWEDWRNGRPQVISRYIVPRLSSWARSPAGEEGDAPAVDHDGLSRADRVHIAFGLDGMRWNEELTVERYGLLKESGLIDDVEDVRGKDVLGATLGNPARSDHCHFAAIAIGRLRAEIKHRPVVFELMNEHFTLFELQKTVEAILGPNLHKQNFRRLVESGGLVEATGEVRARTGGRPARLFRFRREVLLERLTPGVRVNAGR